MAIPFELQLDTDRVVRGDLYPARGSSNGTIVVCHGFKGFKDWGFFPHTAQRLSEAFDVMTFNYSHNGVGPDLTSFSELGKFATQTYTKDLEDLDTLITHIRDQSLPLKHADPPSTASIFLLGHSRGGGIALLYALDHPDTVNGVISWNGVTHVDLLTKEMKEEMRRFGRTYVENARTKQQMPLDRVILEDMEKNRDRYDILQRIKSMTCPVILVQGTEDMPRLLDGSKQLVAANPNVQWVKIKDGQHTFNAVHPFESETAPLKEAIETTERFIMNTLE
ncbi:alpha/beta hydrolase family protein [Caldalkalibacillus salinus]|uniref:alpha/beta hydrolase family protein n=1 Tax=Caldalkalibacillus salinus TaxID=2803787 RepID=UPI0019232994|nr:alpha/beta fold hydrolase [Caldalkalibacillus salinus]